MKKSFLCIILLVAFQFSYGQSESGSEQFWAKLESYCGQSFEGEIIAGAKADDGFTGKKLIMHVKSCEENRIRVPFFVGDDKSRTWVLTLNNNIITLKHDHRHEDGSPEEVTQYGGTSTNTGVSTIQVFPADQETCDLISYAVANVWWMTIDDNSFTYNLRRIDTERLFSVRFDITKPVETPSAPWGWTE